MAKSDSVAMLNAEELEGHCLLSAEFLGGVKGKFWIQTVIGTQQCEYH